MRGWRSFVLCWCLLANAAPAADLDNREGVRTATIQAAAANAHFASEFCALSPAKLSAKKARLRTRLGEPESFEFDWNQGWKHEEETISGFEKLRVENPSLFAKDVKAACAQLADEG